MNQSRKGRRRAGAALVLIILAAAAAVVILLFRIRKVEVVGNSVYSAKQIQEDLMDGPLTGNSLFFTWKYRSAQAQSSTPYLETVRAKLLSPGTVQVIVKERRLIGCIPYNGKYVSFDESGTVLEMTDALPEGIPSITGVTMSSPQLYKKIPLDNTGMRKNILDLCKLIQDSGLAPQGIAIDENQNITVSIGSVDVQLGQAEYLSEKISNLVNLYEKVKNQQGTLNMTAFTGKDESITFKAAETEPPETETETENPYSALSSDVVFQAFDSAGNLHNDAHVVNGQVVDANGNPIDGCYLNEDGNAVDAYWNVTELNLPVNEVTQEETAADNTEAGTGGTAPETNADAAAETNAGGTAEEADADNQDVADTSTGVMVFDSSGTLHYDAHIQGGQVVDGSGNPIPGCSVDENGNIKDAYWNVIDPATGQLMNE